MQSRSGWTPPTTALLHTVTSESSHSLLIEVGCLLGGGQDGSVLFSMAE